MMRYWLIIFIFIFNIVEAKTPEVFTTQLSSILEKYDNKIQVSLYAYSTERKQILQIEPDIMRRSASTIKVALLLEFFAKYEKTLDQIPAKAVDILDNKHHPAWRAYSNKQLNYIRRVLRDKTVRELGHFIIRRYHDNMSRGVAHNAASNLAIALLGGLEKTTKKIQKRLNTKDIIVGRYMNTAEYDDRKKNTLSARTLAKLHAYLAQGNLPHLSPETIVAMRDILYYKKRKKSTEYRKGGDLITVHNDEVPLVRARGGWFDHDDEKIIYAVLTEQKKMKKVTQLEKRLAYNKQKRALNDIIKAIRQYFNV